MRASTRMIKRVMRIISLNVTNLTSRRTCVADADVSRRGCTHQLGARAGARPGLPTPPCRGCSGWPDCASLRGAAEKIGRGLCCGDKQDPGGPGSRPVDPYALPRGAERASPCDNRQDSRHLQPQQARALGRVQRRGPSSLQQGDASRQLCGSLRQPTIGGHRIATMTAWRRHCIPGDAHDGDIDEGAGG